MNLSLEKTWTECIRMWKDIIIILEYVDNVDEAKKLWLKLNGYGEKYICNDCFFCDWVANHPKGEENWDTGLTCGNCPGAQIDSNFNCFNLEYHYYSKPHEFYTELLRLNRIRNAKKTNRKKSKKNSR